MDENNVFKYDGEEIEDHFIMTNKVCEKRIEGFPMDSISIDIDSGQYAVEIEGSCKWGEKIEKGFREFFVKSLENFEI